jgi:hypothetical protein
MGKNQDPGSGINIPDPQHWKNEESSSENVVNFKSWILILIKLNKICFRFEETGEPFRCCGKVECVSLTDRVTKLLDPDVLEIMIGLRYQDKIDNSDLKPESFRFSAYRNLFIMTYGRTRAKMERKPLPSCLVMRVKRQYPDPNNHYTGFKVKRLRKK